MLSHLSDLFLSSSLSFQIETMEDLYVANTIFALNFFKHLANTSATPNLFFSPWSISSTMAMVYLGARGNTADQMAKVSVC